MHESNLRVCMAVTKYACVKRIKNERKICWRKKTGRKCYQLGVGLFLTDFGPFWAARAGEKHKSGIITYAFREVIHVAGKSLKCKCFGSGG